MYQTIILLSYLVDICRNVLDTLDITLFISKRTYIDLKSIRELDGFFRPQFNSTFIFNGYAAYHQKVEHLYVRISY